MKITDITVRPFTVEVDRFHQGVPRRAGVVQTVTTVHTDEGVAGHYFGGHGHGDQDGLAQPARDHIEHRVKPMLVGENPFDRERFWHWMWGAKTPENVMSVIDMALWDLAGRVAGQPVYKLMGGCRDRVKAYASTYPNLGSPQVYAAHAAECVRQGYPAYKIHPYYYWDPETGQSVPARPSHTRWDIEASQAVRDAVGPDVVLMFDPWGTYHTYEDALTVGRALEKLDFYWYEHPMPEHRVEPYVRLCRELDIPVCSPEILEGHVFTRAEWIRREASDISRIDVLRGGITGARKTAIVCEAYGVRCEIHMSGIGNLHVIAATHEDTSEFYERGLLAPGVDYDEAPPYLREPLDQMDAAGYVHLPQRPGLGYDIDWSYIDDHPAE
ncbi:enolase C-terminal domain-like protein [Actinopolymorpha pittospori]|uniref:L-alanine-DL-glutamate epimerase-like enolase superfamily enzyme n=1 Tax=Actinopolymorpha pittospori TaxID=648752 RepID=A0A927MPS8_9ACTN|nr:enolase C-terminal domain-like protein [Actinopolymorpha pittospori]MBE1604640.1 L-alanine-DL-glutamate epimerase-like enolase superfamily enzyme [Actinopolymorpha pittospori]